MKKFRYFSALLAALLLLNLFAFPVTATEGDKVAGDSVKPSIPDAATMDTPGTPVTYGCHSVDARYPICGTDQFLTYSESAVLYEVTSDTMVYTCYPDTQMHPSSFVKVMTAMLALEHGNMDDIIVCKQEVLDLVPYDAMMALFAAGEEVSLGGLINTMLVGSCNDSALLIADHISGSQESFVNLMNRKAAELGCTGTIFQNASGLHHPDQYMTARDMVRILREALKDERFVEIFTSPNYWLEETNYSPSRYFVTTNYMMSDEVYLYYKDSRVTGGRTGTLDNSDRCLAVTASINGGIYIAVTMGTDMYYGDADSRPYSHGSFVDTSALLDIASKASLVRVVDPEQIVNQLPVQGGEHHVSIGSQEVISCVLPPNYSWDMITTRMEMVNSYLTAPIKAGTKVANIQFWYGSICVGETSLFTMIDVPMAAKLPDDPGQQDPGEFDAGALTTALIVLGVIFACILLIFGGLFLVRTVRISMRKARSKKRRIERRRSK